MGAAFGGVEDWALFLMIAGGLILGCVIGIAGAFLACGRKKKDNKVGAELPQEEDTDGATEVQKDEKIAALEKELKELQDKLADLEGSSPAVDGGAESARGGLARRGSRGGLARRGSWGGDKRGK